MTEPQKEYIITEEQLIKMTSWVTDKSLCLHDKRVEIANKVRSRSAKESSDVLDELEKWLYEEGMKFEKICDSEVNFVNATGACARRAQCYYTIEKLKELRTKERERP